MAEFAVLNGSALSKTMDKNDQKVRLTQLSTGAFSRSVARLTDGIRKKKYKYPEMEELLRRDFQCPGSGTVIVRGISAQARESPQQHNRGGCNERLP